MHQDMIKSFLRILNVNAQDAGTLEQSQLDREKQALWSRGQVDGEKRVLWSRGQVDGVHAGAGFFACLQRGLLSEALMPLAFRFPWAKILQGARGNAHC